MTPPLPPADRLRLVFAHSHYGLQSAFAARRPGIAAVSVATRAALAAELPRADVLAVSDLWDNGLLAAAPRLRFVQSVSSGTNQFDAEAFRARGVILCGGAGVNMNAVAEHAFGLLFALTRRIAGARDNQRRRHWPDYRRDPALREAELAGKTLLLVGMGKIGTRIAEIARIFGLRVLGLRRTSGAGAGAAHEVHPFTALPALMPRADVILLCCPLSEETRGILSAEALARARPGALVINVARGACVDEPALIAALREGRLGGAGLDVTAVEPLPGDSPLWHMPNVVLTPHTGGETGAYEENFAALLDDNLDRLWRGAELINRIA